MFESYSFNTNIHEYIQYEWTWVQVNGFINVKLILLLILLPSIINNQYIIFTFLKYVSYYHMNN